MSVYLEGHLVSFTAPLPDERRKAQRVKLMEEAAEAFEAAHVMEDVELEEGYDASYERLDLADELSDVIQCCVNLADVHGIGPDELMAALDRCRDRNHGRGRC